MTLIVLEGADGVGKSSLARELHTHPDLPNCRLIHKGPPETDHLLREYLADIAWYRADQPQLSNVVCDRWHLGELVYPLLQRGRETLATRETLAYLQLWLLSRGALLVHVEADTTVVYRRRTERRESVVNSATINSELELFLRAFDLSHQRKLSVRTDSGVSTSDLVKHVLLQAVSEMLHVSPLAQFTSYVGPRVPDVLLVGDERGPARFDYGNFTTAFAPLPATSGDFLLRALPDGLLCTSRVGITNANDANDVLALWDTLSQPPVVALGRKAYDGCVRSGLTDATLVGSVPHPQYIRRFHHSRRTDYGRLITRVTETKEDMRKWPQ